MPKKASKPKGGQRGNSSAAPASASSKPDNDEFKIIFTNSKTEPKTSNSSNSKPKTQDNGEPNFEVKKPTAKQLVGGASWTGKLPVNILSEHCQKQKWSKPDYSMRKEGEQFSSMVSLKSVDPKSKEVVSLPPFKLPPSYKELALRPTAVEARNFAATYALFRVCSMRNIHMMLPPTYRDLWKKEFSDAKKSDVNEGKGWMYEADPFNTLKERNDAKANDSKKREIRKAQNEKQHSVPGGTDLAVQSGGSSATDRHHRLKGWNHVPSAEIGRKTRLRMEKLISKHAVWNPRDIQLSQDNRNRLINELTRLGFRQSHVSEACTYCKDREEALEWLLIHIPEDDLPRWSLPENYTAGISLASNDLKREGALRRLSAMGYASDLCERIFGEQEDNERKAAEALQNAFTAQALGETMKIPSDSNEAWSEEANQALWKEEQDVLESVYGDRYSSSEDSCWINLEVPGFSGTIKACFERPISGRYPFIPPVLSFESEPRLPAHVRLSIIRRSVDHCISNFLGDQMILILVEWLESNVDQIISHPGLLKDISMAISPIDKVETGAGRPLPSKRKFPRHTKSADPNANSQLLQAWEDRQAFPAQIKMIQGRKELPAWQIQEQAVDCVRNFQVSIVSGETGSGKSTQVVQFILDHLIQTGRGASTNIICTQPRRISAISLADRVSEERCSKVGEEIGYSIRGESKQSTNTKITFVTTGVLLRRLQTSGGRTEDIVSALADVSHIFIDEVHERNVDTDFLLVILKDVLKQRRDLKLVLMSATIDSDTFVNYFGGASRVGQIVVSGRTFPVEDYYLDHIQQLAGIVPPEDQTRGKAGWQNDGLEVDSRQEKKSQFSGAKGIDYSLLTKLVEAVDENLGLRKGGILIFLPGVAEINRVIGAIKSDNRLHVVPLHASLLPAEQKRCFDMPPKGRRKVVVATNVAETSITIPDIIVVVDSGKVKETSFDPVSNMVKLSEVWASQAACKQRRGRAGRVTAGTCYKLYTKKTESVDMPSRPEPEICRIPLEQLCLAVKAMGIDDVPAFLGRALSPPNTTAIEGALKFLERIDALDNNQLTALGRHLSLIPADIRIGKLLVYGALFSCVGACLTLAAILSVRSPFISSATVRDDAKAARAKFSVSSEGDLLTDMRAYDEWTQFRASHSSKETRNWCDERFLAQHTLWEITSNREQYQTSLKEIGFLPQGASNHSNQDLKSRNDYSMLRGIVAGAFAPQIARIALPNTKYVASASGSVEIDPEARTIKYFGENERLFVHPSSTLFDAQGFSGGSRFLAFFTKMATSKIFIRDLTPFNAMTLLLFGGQIEVDTLGRGLTVDGWLRVRGWARLGVLISRLKGLFDDILAQMIEKPGVAPPVAGEVVALVRHLVELNGLDN